MPTCCSHTCWVGILLNIVLIRPGILLAEREIHHLKRVAFVIVKDEWVAARVHSGLSEHIVVEVSALSDLSSPQQGGQGLLDRRNLAD